VICIFKWNNLMKVKIPRFFRKFSAMVSIIGFFAFVDGESARAEMFGVHYLGNATSDTVTGTAGVVPISGWNNVDQSTFGSGTILSSDGLFSATLALSGSGAGFGWNSGMTGDGGNGSLLNGYNDAGINNPSASTITGLTSATYDVYLYTFADTARPGNGGDWLPNYTVNGTTYYTATMGGGGAFSGFIEGGITFVNSNTFPTSLTYGNYIKISNVSTVGNAITITANGDNQSWRSPFNGFELVAVVVPEPSTWAMMIVGVGVIGFMRRRSISRDPEGEAQ
jgi:hypothetical protein